MDRFTAKKAAILFNVLIMILLGLTTSFNGASISAPSQVRLALVNVPDDLVKTLLADFKKQSGYDAEIVYTGNDPFSEARNGKADLVISHFGHEGVEAFISAGLGLWPHPVFANQMALLGPANDPARIRGLSDATEAFRKIAGAKSPFLANNNAGTRYLEEILWISAGQPAKGDWYIHSTLQGRNAVQEASSKGAYVLWGLAPFLRMKRETPLKLEALVTADSIFQRIMVSIVVNSEKISGINTKGAAAFQEYLISPATQAKVRAFRYPDFSQQAWWPSGRHNSSRE
jgi:tungstate transport system substrate-binding protein